MRNSELTNPNWKNQTIWTGDCLDIMRGMNSQSVDLIYTVIDCGGRNTEAFRATLTICDTLIAPWTTG